ncbi:MAG: hypothetical protein MUP16_11335 [Sedimentisphaerales bacterium]|nr:hypothetical protein [Sedimentisphaerales bacterium]
MKAHLQRGAKYLAPSFTGGSFHKTGARHIRVLSAGQLEAELQAGRGKYFKPLLIAAYLAFGIYLSALYFGHKVVPISDFPDIVKVGHDLLSFRLPVRFKQAPVVGLLQALLSYVVGGQHPDLTAGWLLNAILHPLNLVLFYLIGKQIVGRAAIWFAIIAILNHWIIYMLTEPIMETSLLFFSLVTFYLIFNRSSWCYVFASITTMVRYEGAALILAAFVMDMIYGKNKRERIRAFLYSAIAAIPLALWMLGTILTWKADESHYLSVLFSKDYANAFTQPVEQRTGLLLHIKLLWTVAFQPLFMPYPGADDNFAGTVWKLSKTLAALGFFFGVVYGLRKRQWKILALLIFFVPYFLLHAFYPYPLQRYHTNIFWIALLICLFGLQGCWKLVDGKGRLPKSLSAALQCLIAVVSIIWLVPLIRYLPKLSLVSPRSVFVPYAAMVLVGLIFTGRVYIYRLRYFLREFSILLLLCLIIVSNQFMLSGFVGDGLQDEEFKLLADWYIANTKPGEKIGVYMAGVVKIFAPKYAQNIIHLPKAESPSEFIKACHQQNITYVVWASREGLRDDHTGYRQFNLHKNMAHLQKAESTEDYQFVKQIGTERGYVNIFHLR